MFSEFKSKYSMLKFNTRKGKEISFSQKLPLISVFIAVRLPATVAQCSGVFMYEESDLFTSAPRVIRICRGSAVVHWNKYNVLFQEMKITIKSGV